MYSITKSNLQLTPSQNTIIIGSKGQVVAAHRMGKALCNSGRPTSSLYVFSIQDMYLALLIGISRLKIKKKWLSLKESTSSVMVDHALLG